MVCGVEWRDLWVVVPETGQAFQTLGDFTRYLDAFAAYIEGKGCTIEYTLHSTPENPSNEMAFIIALPKVNDEPGHVTLEGTININSGEVIVTGDNNANLGGSFESASELVKG
ncbi:hypothetical protein GF325_16940 [Candidatus Bathyarchaeota archaeon]|nr:hypothetical protein [Candidatus Bathyarchaeota archaeon]